MFIKFLKVTLIALLMGNTQNSECGMLSKFFGCDKSEVKNDDDAKNNPESTNEQQTTENQNTTTQDINTQSEQPTQTTDVQTSDAQPTPTTDVQQTLPETEQSQEKTSDETNTN